MSDYKKRVVSLMFASALLSTSAVAAQEQVELATNVEITGVVTHIDGWTIPFGYEPSMLPLDFVVRIEQQNENYTIVDSPSLATLYRDVGVTIELELLDSEGVVFYSDSHTTSFPRSNTCMFTSAPVAFAENMPIIFDQQSVPTADAMRFCIETEDFSSIYKLMEVYVGSYAYNYPGDSHPVIDTLLTDGPLSSFVSLQENYPALITGESIQAFEYVSWQYDISNWEYPDTSLDLDFMLYGYTTHISAIINDADEDGIADEVDQCSASLLDETVSFDGIDSGVANVVDANGCSVMDHYAACEADQQSSGFLGYSGVSYCEQQVAYQLYRDGLIDYADVRALRNALN